MKLRIVLLTRTGRPSGAAVARQMIEAGNNLMGIVAEDRRQMIQGRRTIYQSFCRVLERQGLSFVVSKLVELAQIKIHLVLRRVLPKGNLLGTNYHSIEELILDYRVPFFRVNDHNGPECIALLRTLSPDVIVVTNTRILSEELIGVAPLGCLNLHMGKLPQYAGLASIFWALYNGESEIGITVHFVNKELDAGDIIIRGSLAVGKRDTEHALYKEALKLGSKMMVHALSQVESGRVPRIPQDKGELRYYPWPSRRQRTALRRRLRSHRVEHRIKNLHIITRLVRGGAQENTLLTVTGLDHSRYETDLVSGPTTGRGGEMESKAREAGIDLRIVPELVREISPLNDVIALAKLYFLIRKGKYDIVHTHTSKAGFLGRVAARLAGVPIIVHTPHGHIFYGYFGSAESRLFILFEKLAALVTDRIVTLTEKGKEDHIQTRIGPADKFIPIHSGIDLSSLDSSTDILEARRRFGLDPETPLVGTVGRLAPVKGQRYLIDAASRVLKVVPGAEFLLVGDGPCRQELEDQVKQLDLSDKVRFLGLRESGIREITIALDVFVLPSLNEGMGKSLVMAMALGKPVVASAVGGVPEIVRDGETGILVHPADPEALAKAIIALLKNEKVAAKMGRRGKKRVVSGFSSRLMVEKIDNLYIELLAAKRLVNKAKSAREV